MKNYKMNFFELQVTLSLCMVFLLRMLGVFSILPVLSKYGLYLDGGNKFLIGLSVSIYAVNQMIFQFLFGYLSDKFSRKKIIIFGLFIFLVGSIVAACTHSIWGLIIGRCIQGSSAISGVSMALLSDLVSKENHIKSISAIGASFAVSFLIAIVFSPLISENLSFSSIFWFSSIFSIICILIIYFIIPSSMNKQFKKEKKYFTRDNIKYLFNKNFCVFYLGIFFLHCLLTMHLLIIPHQLENNGLMLNNHWIVYLSTIIISFVILYFIIFYRKLYFYLKNIIEICIFLIFLSLLIILFLFNNLVYSILSLQIFFIAFNILEMFLPSYLTKKISVNYYKGSIMSIYSASQYLGISLGGVISGWLYMFLNISEMFLFEVFLVFIWFIFNCFCKK